MHPWDSALMARGCRKWTGELSQRSLARLWRSMAATWPGHGLPPAMGSPVVSPRPPVPE